MRKDLNDLCAEIEGAAMIVSGLLNQLDNDKTDSLTVKSMQSALFGVSEYLLRISADLCELV